MATNPFAPSTSSPGVGEISVSLLPPVLRTVSYQYPLKLIAPAPLPLPSQSSSIYIHTVFLLTYGGGLVAGDTIDLTVNLDPHTRLVLLTQGSTKIFKTPVPSTVSSQRMVVHLAPGSALCYLPDPVQPFVDSAFTQSQVYELLEGKKGEDGKAAPKANLCVCDWVSEGRSARGEKWGFHMYGSRNEVWSVREASSSSTSRSTSTSTSSDALPKNQNTTSAPTRRLLLRDNMILDAGSTALGGPTGLTTRMDDLGIFGTLILRGPLFESLGAFFMEEFSRLPRIGGRQWDRTGDSDDEHDGENASLSEPERWRKDRLKQETADGLLWSSANIRGFVLVKFGAREVEGARSWLRSMLRKEGTVEKNFGERAVLCLK